MAAVAQFDRHRIRERILDVRTDKYKRGVYAGGRRPFGYDIEEVDSKERRLIPNVAELGAIPEMHGLKVGGASLRSIAARMTSQGFELSHTGIRQILEDWPDQTADAGCVATA